MNSNGFLRPKQFAKILQVSLTTLWRMWAKHKLIPPPKRISLRAVGWPAKQVNEFIRQLSATEGRDDK